MLGEAGPPPEQEQMIEGTIEPDVSDAHHFWHEVLVWSSSVGGSAILIALITAWFNRDKIKKRFWYHGE